MSMNLTPEKFSCEPEYLLASTDICVTTAIKAAAADLKAGAPVKLDASGKVHLSRRRRTPACTVSPRRTLSLAKTR